MGELIPFDAGRPPAVLQGRQSSLNAAAKAGVQASFAVVGYRGRNWRLKYRGDETLVADQEGNPLPYLDVVIVGVASTISKQWYEKKFVEGSDDSPDCFSTDGMAPDPTSPKKQHATCATCPRNAWGSRVTDAGKKAKACADSRRLVVVPLYDIENESFGGPMLLRIPPTTLNNLANYAGLLDKKGAGLECVATRLKFDNDVAYPLIEFHALGWLTNEQATEVLQAMEHPQIERMLSEAVAEAAAEVAADPLAGAPAQVFAHPHATPVATVAAPATSAVATPSVVETTSAPTAVAKPAPRKRASPFQAAAQEPAAAVPVAAAQPVTTAPVVVQDMPEDMNAAIDNLLNMEVAG
jgi:hypothetical protein